MQMGAEDPGGETPEIEAIMEEQAGQITTPDLISVIRIFNSVAADTRSKWHPGLPLEIAFLEACEKLGEGSPVPEKKNPRPEQTSRKSPPRIEIPQPELNKAHRKEILLRPMMTASPRKSTRFGRRY